MENRQKIEALTNVTKYADYVKELNNLYENTMAKDTVNDSASAKYEKYIKLLKANHNIILSGAPGTGKTYLAKEIAKAMGAEVGFVQFHPSYDYTDFVEGMRPTPNGAFERMDGVFKAFCKKALEQSKTSIETEKKNEIQYNPNSRVSYYSAIQSFKADLKKQRRIMIKSIRSSTLIPYVLGDNGRIYVPKQSMVPITDESLVEYMRTRRFQHGETYKPALGEYILQHYYNAKDKEEAPVIQHIESKADDRTFVFIIDEINRGEISKIFGELFFSIDPGYRGEKGKVQTQYQNLVEDDDVFKDGFFVPENVYIIGTMNDIDRSVEPMDFAMRRRFVWKEITAEESAENIGIKGNKLERMKRLNGQIAKTAGLGKDYQLGGVYFNDSMDAEERWNLKIYPLLKEYLRGVANVDEELEKLKDAYETEE